MFLLSRRSLAASAVASLAVVLPALSLGAQTHRVAKAASVTRAVGVYEWTGELNKPTASRLVPVSLFIDGHFQDAGVYLARPVPFALSAGYVYAVEKSGEPLGTVDLSEARNMVAQHGAEDDNPLSAWFGYGRYIPPPAAPKVPALHTSAHPGVIVGSTAKSGANSDAGTRPHLSDRSTDNTTKDDPAKRSTRPADSPTAPAPAPDSAKTGEGTPSATAEDPDRPHMSRRSDTAPTGGDPAPSTANTSDTAADDDPERPTLRRHTDAKTESKRRKESGSGVRPMATSLNDDPDRPTLHRGSEDTPGATPPLNGNPPGLQQAVAVSDPTNVDTHLFARAWDSPTERASTLAALRVLARPRVGNYLLVNQLKPGTAQVLADAAAAPAPGVSSSKTLTPALTEDTGPVPRLQRGRPTQGTVPAPVPLTPKVAPTAPAGTAARRPPHTAVSHTRTGSAGQLLLLEEQITAFSLSYGGVPTFVYSAVTPTTEGAPVHITLIAQQLPSGELQVALSSVTDEAHLDRTPWMRLVDAVDPNNSHRASFLFELRAKASRQFALYSLVSAHAEQSFVTGLMQ